MFGTAFSVHPSIHQLVIVRVVQCRDNFIIYSGVPTKVLHGLAITKVVMYRRQSMVILILDDIHE
jgi:hypothetical protein